MDRWKGRVALVTGANSGIGLAIAKTLVEAGMKVVGADVNLDQMQDFSKESQVSGGFLTAIKCDLLLEKDIDSLFDAIDKKFGGLDVCINNAGLVYLKNLLDGSMAEWREMFNVNVLALCYCSKLSTASMLKKGISDGQIINLSSCVAHRTKYMTEVNFYGGTKHAVKFLTEGLRQEMIQNNYKIRVASISPSHVRNTSIFNRSGSTWDEFQAKSISMDTQEISKLVLYILSAPSEIEINEVIIRAQGMSE